MRGDAKLSRRSVLAGASLLAAARAAAGTPSARLTVFAAASLTEALTRVGGLWQAHGEERETPRLSFGSSGTLAKQIDAGAPADLFLSADQKWMDWLAGKGRLVPGSRRDLLGNRLVLVERTSTLKPVTLGPGTDLAALLGAGGRLAVGDPAQVPAGIYAQQALTSLGLWQGMRGRLAPAQNVRAALLLVERGEAPAGIVYASDVRAAPSLGVAGVFPRSSHPPIVYPGAVLKAAADPAAAARFLSFLASPAAQSVFRDYGFIPP